MPQILPPFGPVKALVQKAQDDIIDFVGRSCQLVFESAPGFCPNCIWDSIGNQSSNRYKPGGPEEFEIGDICPVCGGSGKAPGTDTVELIQMFIEFNPKNWVSFNTNKDPLVRIADGVISSKGYVSDLNKVMTCDYLIVDEYRYKLARETVKSMNIVQGRYFICLWTREAN